MKRKPTKPKQSPAYLDQSKDMAYIHTRLLKAQKQELERIHNELPKFKKYKAKPQTIVYKAGQAGASKIVPKLMEHILMKGAGKKTNIEIVREVRPLFPEHNIPDNVMNKPLQRWDVDAIKELMAAKMKEPVNIKGCKTLSQIRKKIKLDKQIAKRVLSYKPVITVNRKSFVINGKAYPIELHETGKYQYLRIRIDVDGKRTPLRLDALLELLDS